MGDSIVKSVVGGDIVSGCMFDAIVSASLTPYVVEGSILTLDIKTEVKSFSDNVMISALMPELYQGMRSSGMRLPYTMRSVSRGCAVYASIVENLMYGGKKSVSVDGVPVMLIASVGTMHSICNPRGSEGKIRDNLTKSAADIMGARSLEYGYAPVLFSRDGMLISSRNPLTMLIGSMAWNMHRQALDQWATIKSGRDSIGSILWDAYSSQSIVEAKRFTETFKEGYVSWDASLSQPLPWVPPFPCVARFAEACVGTYDDWYEFVHSGYRDMTIFTRYGDCVWHSDGGKLEYVPRQIMTPLRLPDKSGISPSFYAYSCAYMLPSDLATKHILPNGALDMHALEREIVERNITLPLTITIDRLSNSRSDELLRWGRAKSKELIT